MIAASAAFLATPAAAAALALLLWRRGLQGRLFLDALAIGLTLGALIAAAEAPFELKSNPRHFSAAAIAFLFAGLPEEGAKMLGAAAFLRGHWRARSPRDVTLATGALALAFAVLENVFYVSLGGVGALAVDRALTALPFHVFLGLAGGFVVANVRADARGVGLALLGWLGVAGLHGFYDYAAFAARVPLQGLLALAEALAALAAAAALARVAPAGPPGLVGWLIGLPLALAAALAMLAGGFAALALETLDPLRVAFVLGLAPLAIGWLLLGRARLSRAVRWAAGGLVLAALAAAVVFGPGQWRQLTVMRYETEAARASARGDDRAAVETLTQALAVSPDVPIYARRAASLTRLKRYPAALADIDAARRRQPRELGLLKQRAEIDRLRNDPPAVIADLDDALDLKPGDPDLLALRGEARLDAGDPEGAYLDLDAASRQAPDNALTRRTFAIWDVAAGDFDAALKDLNARLHADPEDLTALFQRGRVWLYKGEPARALADFARADRDPAFLYPALWRYLARAAMKQDGGADLLGRLSKAPDAWPAPVARQYLGLLSRDAARAATSDADETCEADYYFAALRLARYGLNEAEPGLRAALQECPTGFIEYEAAKAQLRRAGR